MNHIDIGISVRVMAVPAEHASILAGVSEPEMEGIHLYGAVNRGIVSGIICWWLVAGAIRGMTGETNAVYTMWPTCVYKAEWIGRVVMV